VSANVGPTYAPTVLAREPGAKGMTSRTLQYAMSELLRDGQILVRQEGRPGKSRSRLEIAHGAYIAT
jgi:hypothetical protein